MIGHSEVTPKPKKVPWGLPKRSIGLRVSKAMRSSSAISLPVATWAHSRIHRIAIRRQHYFFLCRVGSLGGSK